MAFTLGAGDTVDKPNNVTKSSGVHLTRRRQKRDNVVLTEIRSRTKGPIMSQFRQRSIGICAFALPVLMLIYSTGLSSAQPASSATSEAPLDYAVQRWLPADRDTFYTTSQGSHMMRYAWFKALRRLDVDEPFGGDRLQRYGYLSNEFPKKPFEDLPIGFVVDGDPTSGQLGMTCAACHTAQLEYQKGGTTRALRIDGAPAHADFQQFLNDLTAVVRATMKQPARFDAFAKAVLGAAYSTANANRLSKEFGAWVNQFGEFMDLSLPPSPWGPGRLDAFGMIFNRVAGRDIGILNNFKIADAPVSYPFLWNAPRQDRTQWNGGVPNGLYIHGLGRNTGEVFGVFAEFSPKRFTAGTPINLPVVNFRNNSASFSGLQTLEEKIAALKPPPWPRDAYPLDENLVARGKPLFETHCGECHAERPSNKILNHDVWDTPIKAVGTDPRMIINSERMSGSGLLAGALMPPPPVFARLPNPAKTGEILATAVVGSLLGEATSLNPNNGVWRALRLDLAVAIPNFTPTPANLVRAKDFILASLSGIFQRPGAAGTEAAYESRVLSGIWATAPYLHNGSVPNLWELLKPPKQRMSSFMVGSRVFDPKNVGFATDKSPLKNANFVTDPNNTNGNGNGGHEYGTSLTEDERWAIVEYLKTL
jgi:hypothetical protein